jgi:hypothetical protein
MIISALKEGLQAAHNSVKHLLGIVHFKNKCLIFMHEMEAVMAPHREEYKNMWKAKCQRSPLFH